MPMAIDRAAAITDSRIVAPKPSSRKVMLFQPCVVRGSITYQPQLPAAPQPVSASRHARARPFFIAGLNA